MKRKRKSTSSSTYSVAEVAEKLDTGINQAYEAVRRGDIPAIRIGRVWRVLKAPFDRMLEGGKAA